MKKVPALLFCFFLSFACRTSDIREGVNYTYLKANSSSPHVHTSPQGGIVAADHPLAIQAGEAVMKVGGNAIDGAVATSFVTAVVLPEATGLGGGGFLLYYDKIKKNVDVFDFRERAPNLANRAMYLNSREQPLDFIYKGTRLANASLNGHLAVGTPGFVAGLIEAHQKYGSLPLATLIQPAIDIADKGFVVNEKLAQAIIKRSDVLQSFPASRDLFFPQGKALQKGDLLVQKDLANTLRLIAEKGRNGFYKGVVADKIIAEVKSGKGILTYADLEFYHVKKRKPVIGSYRGYKIVSMPPPSSGGVHLIQMLNMLEQDKLQALGQNSASYVHLLSEVMRRAYADRAEYLGDPDFVDIPLQGLISKNYAHSLRQNIDNQHATPSKDISAGNPHAYESPSTTHISVVDQWGNAVSTTQTINYLFGSGVVVPGTGIILNDEMDDFSISPHTPNVFGLVGGEANAVAAHKTMLSSMSPTLVFDQQDKLKLVVGAPGGSRIITATLQTIVNVLDFHMPLEFAVEAPRIHHQWLPDEITMEPKALSIETQKELQRKGHKISTTKDPIGIVQAIAPFKKGWIAVSDGR
jgi:gamma-glutamyltranspeptidase/glutathione hydrolase